MSATTHPDWNHETEALQVAKAFPDRVRGKTVLITGVNVSGIGFATAKAFASQAPAHLIITGRNLAKIEESIEALRSSFPEVDYKPLQLDLSSQRGVRKAAAEVLSWNDITSINILVNNAGIMNLPERTLNEEGIEMQFATNHIGHFLFTCSIMPKLLEAAKHEPKGAVRIVNVSSLSPTWSSMRWSDINFDKINTDLPEAEQPPYAVHKAWGIQDPESKSYLPLEGYNQSKVANLLFSIGANKRLYKNHGILSFTIHPGVIKTELSRHAPPEIVQSIKKMADDGHISYKTPGAGASTSLTAALDPILGPGKAQGGKENLGTYLADCQVNDKATPLAESNVEAERLWNLSESLVHEKFAW